MSTEVPYPDQSLDVEIDPQPEPATTPEARGGDGGVGRWNTLLSDALAELDEADPDSTAGQTAAYQFWGLTERFVGICLNSNRLSPEARQDLTQDILMTVFSRLGTFERGPDQSPNAWIKQICTNRYLHFLRAQSAAMRDETRGGSLEMHVETNGEAEIDSVGGIGIGAQSGYGVSAETLFFQRANPLDQLEHGVRVAALSPAQREILVRFHLFGHSREEVMRDLTLAPGTFDSRLRRGRHRLTNVLSADTDD